MALKIALNRIHTSLDVLIFAEFIKLENKKDITISWNENSNEKSYAHLYDKDGTVLGENNNMINRYLARTMNPAFYGNTLDEKTRIDHWLSFATLLQIKQKNSLDYLNRELITQTWLVGHKLTLADIHVFSALKCQEYMKVYEKELYKNNYCNITRWYKHVKSFPAVENAILVVAKNCPPPSELKDTNLQKEKSITKQTKARKQEGKFIDLPGAEMGKVVVRFPPEASGYLHIGHAKAALLNQYYAEAFQGQLIMRFDDTNPAKETVEFEEAILEDLRLLQIKPDRFTHTSDYFEILQEYCTTLIKNGKAYVDGTPANLMKEQRDRRLKSKYRDNSIEENLALWEEMKRGTEKGQEYCVRAKIDYQSTNGCMRDPTIYRCKPESHPRTGNKYRVYPTYDFACPIVDSIENITHTLRTTEYHDRDAQFYWIIEALELRRPYIWEYSRLNMTYTVLSKRKLTWFVNQGLVDGWDDPRFPTVRGILRRGMTVKGLKQFIIVQGSSRSIVFMEWDKIWSFNKKVIDPLAVRYTALDYNEIIPVNIVDAKEEWLTVQNHPKDSSKGTKRVRVGPKILIEREDAERLIEGQNATFINWGNLMIQKINRQVGNIVDVEAQLNLEDKNYKNTLKITWLAESCKSDPSAKKSNPIKCYAVYFDHIMNIPVLGKDDDFKNFVAKDTRKEIQMLGEVELKRVKKGEIIQLQRKGFFICDVPYAPRSPYSLREQPVILFHIPDGHTTTPYMTPAVSYNQQEDKTQRVETREIIYRNPIAGIEDAKVKFGGTEILNPIWKDKLQSVMKKAETLMPYDTISGTLRITEGSLLYPLYIEEETMEHTYVDMEDYFTHLIQARSDRATVLADVFPLVFNEQNRKSHGGVLPFEIAADKDLEKILEKISKEIKKQGDKVRNLKSSKADKSRVDLEVKILLSLKNKYKSATGPDWKSADTTAASIVSNAKAEKLSEEIKEQGYRMRDLKMLKDKDKKYIERQEKILLSLKSDYKNMTGQDWTPLLKKVSRAEKISEEIKKQGDKVRNLKKSTADKIDQEMKFLLNLKNEYKSAIGQDWKTADTMAASTVSNAKAEGKEISKAEKLSEEIKEQGCKVRDLKMLKDKDKRCIERQEKILLSLKSDYKNMTGQYWTPLLKKISKAEIMSDEIKKQGDKVRNLKSSTADEIDQEVKILLSLKNEYKNATGQDWKPTVTTAANTVSNAKAKEKEISNAEKISEEIKKQGDKVRDLKSLKIDKSIIEQEVKILLSLKSDYKNATGQDWKPGTKVANIVSNTQTDDNKAKELFERFQKKGHNLEYLQGILGFEMDMLWNLKKAYESTFGRDWKPIKARAANTIVSNTEPESKKISKVEKISEEIKKQGDKVRNVKNSKADKSIIDQEVKVLLNLKSDYKNATGQDWRPANSEAALKKEKQNTPKPGRTSEKEVAKNADGRNADTSKTGTRLGLEAKKEENFFDWYSQVITKSGMIEYYDVSGCYILRPWSFAIWKIIKEYIDKEITALGVQECYFPIFVTRSVLEKEKAHIADFAPEVAWVTKCGESDLAEPIAIRPTSETVMYPAYAKWLRSDTELPLRLNQWNNVVRWEFKDPKPFLRTREFLWQEGHTAFATKVEAEEEVLIILDMYARVYEDLLAVPVIKGRKTEKEKFAGGDYTTTVEAFISTSGRAIQGATSHHLGQNFSKMFNIQIEGAANGDEKTFVYQNSWGLTTRTVGVMIMVHGDDQGLVLPPNVASIQAIVIPCGVTASMSESKRKELQAECVSLIDQLSKESKFRVKGDFRNNRTPGWKFNHWELKGVPVRIELGPRDMEKNQVTFVRRDNFERVVVNRDDVTTSLVSTLNDVQEKLLLRARKKLNEHIKRVENWTDFGYELNKKNLLLSPFCGEPACEDNIKVDSARENISDEPGVLSMGAKSLCIPFEQPELTKPLNELKCIHHSCKNKPKFYTLFGRTY